MGDERHLLSVDLGPVCDEALNELAKQTKSSKSEVVRDCILVAYHFGLAKDFKKLRDTVDDLRTGKHTAKTKTKITNSEREIVQTYVDTYDYSGRIYYPAVLGALRAVAKTLDYETIKECIAISPKLPSSLAMLSENRTPTLQSLLSEKVMGTLLHLVEKDRKDRAHANAVRLDGFVRPRAIREICELLPPAARSVAFDLISKAESEEEIDRIKEAAFKEAALEALTELNDEINKLTG